MKALKPWHIARASLTHVSVLNSSFALIAKMLGYEVFTLLIDQS
jgi:hypothetical protein